MKRFLLVLFKLFWCIVALFNIKISTIATFACTLADFIDILSDLFSKIVDWIKKKFRELRSKD